MQLLRRTLEFRVERPEWLRAGWVRTSSRTCDLLPLRREDRGTHLHLRAINTQRDDDDDDARTDHQLRYGSRHMRGTFSVRVFAGTRARVQSQL